MYYEKNERNQGAWLPDAVALIQGNTANARIRGTVKFFEQTSGVLVVADIEGLPVPNEPCGNTVFGFHIHGGASCGGNESDPFANAGTHYNPNGCPHPYHAGDMPPLFGASGHAFLSFLTDRFNVSEMIGKTVIIHDRPDDFTTQPSGNAGNKIACGVITAVKR